MFLLSQNIFYDYLNILIFFAENSEITEKHKKWN